MQCGRRVADERPEPRARRRGWLLIIALALVAGAASACTPAARSDVASSAETPPVGTRVAGTTPPTPPTLPTPPTSPPGLPLPIVAAPLGALRIDDHPHKQGYRRSDWPTWKDIDGDGCDARDEALIAASTTPVGADGCKVRTGTWHSDYDNITYTDPTELDVDHVVPLEEAYASGGWQWATDRRALYANDQGDLWVVSRSSNRSKGSRGPDQWRPPAKTAWCPYARRWVAIKVRWELTATTEERDALGQMLDTCTT